MTRLVLGVALFAAVAAVACSGSALSPTGPSASGVSPQRFSASTPAITALSQDGPEDKSELEGQITAIDPVAHDLVVRATTIHVPPDAIIRHGHTLFAFTDLTIGARIHVRAAQNGTIVARLIVLQNEHDDEAENTEVEGAVAGLANSCPAVTFTVGTLSIVTSDKTTFRAATCAQITNNLEVEIRGTLQANGTLLASTVSVSHEGDEDGD